MFRWPPGWCFSRCCGSASRSNTASDAWAIGGAAVLHPYHETVLALGCQRYLCFFHVRRPAHLEPLLDALVHRTVVFVMRKCAVGFRTLPLGNFQMVEQLYGRD